MDLTLKGKSWAARFVENKVQSVGTSVKRLYSNVAKSEPQTTRPEQATTVDEKQLYENQGSIGNFRNSDGSFSSTLAENVTFCDVSSNDEEEEKEMRQKFSSSDILDTDFIEKNEISELEVGMCDLNMVTVEKDEISELEVGICDLNMVTVDLSPDVKQVEPNVILNGNFVHSATHGKRNFQYYKKLVEDTLTSRKRLSKEYKHLAILYGDIEFESSQHFEPNSAPSSSSNSSVHAVRTQSPHEMSETEWELV